jgi:tRNA threonylcarbamoyladenosine biosynthesis protein TsaB
VCGVSVSKGALLMAEYSVYERNLHDRLLSELTRRLLNDLDIKIEDLDAVAVSSGPGSFTGLRIGAALAKAMCYGNKPALIGVPTLTAIANECLRNSESEGAEVHVILPSHKDLVYHQRFGSGLNELSGVEFCEISVVNDAIKNHEVVCSPGLELKNGKQYKFDGMSPVLVGRLALEYYNMGRFEDAENFAPAYYQEFTPKVK